MDIILVLVPLALLMGLLGLIGFIWALKKGQMDDPEGDAARILADDRPAPPPPHASPQQPH